jgi:hypothetical protein
MIKPVKPVKDTVSMHAGVKRTTQWTTIVNLNFEIPLFWVHTLPTDTNSKLSQPLWVLICVPYGAKSAVLFVSST